MTETLFTGKTCQCNLNYNTIVFFNNEINCLIGFLHVECIMYNWFLQIEQRQKTNQFADLNIFIRIWRERATLMYITVVFSVILEILKWLRNSCTCKIIWNVKFYVVLFLQLIFFQQNKNIDLIYTNEGHSQINW